ncbi:MAG: hypothetical protein E6Q69_05020 [Aquipseudomonas alcaligenes]|uniref:Uncharacterized protein n=1 Tax=Aquipseudomonas alcaligenes TaxID=43263 RepID=A0A5C7WBV1_AQUAC|nr:MAG: hypothetical protein E6Q69_05020 [Pseudomonas alcaligenes]
MKEPWYMGMPEYFSKLVNGRNSLKLLLVCLAFSIVSSLANRWLYEEFPSLSLAFKIPVGVLVAAGGMAGIYVFGVLSYRLNRLRHVAFGLIELVVLIAVARFVMINLREMGLEPVSGPPVFGGLIACVIFGWVFGVLLTGLDRCNSES